MSTLKKELDSAIPQKYIESREQAGRKLEYLAGAYVIDRLNQVLGQGKWGYQVMELRKVFEGKVAQRSGEAYSTSYIAIVTITAKLESESVTFTDVGYGDGADRGNAGKAHELAVKEAVTDGVKRAAKNLGRSMGLELYFKTDVPPQEGESEAPKQPKAKTMPAPQTPPIPPKSNLSEAQIKRLFAIANAKKWTKDNVKAYMVAKYGIDSTSQLDWKNYEEICQTMQVCSFDQALAGK